MLYTYIFAVALNFCSVMSFAIILLGVSSFNIDKWFQGSEIILPKDCMCIYIYGHRYIGHSRKILVVKRGT